MSDDLIFYYNPQSRAQMAHWMLEEVGADYRIRLIDFTKNEQKSPEFLALNPMGKVPAIVHHGTVVTESGAIIAYLADAFPDAGLAPAPGDPARGTWLRWLFFGGTCFEPALIEKMMMNQPVDDKRKVAVGWGNYDDTIAALRTALQPGPYILGDSFSAADVYVGAEIAWAMSFKAPGLAGDPLFDAYVARLRQRPAFQRTTRLTAG